MAPAAYPGNSQSRKQKWISDMKCMNAERNGDLTNTDFLLP